MFGTLKINSKNDSVEFIEHARGEAATRLGGYVFSQAACERCRLKKLGCNKHRSGCDRCKGQGLKCSYQTVVKGNSSWSSPTSHSEVNLSSISRTAGPGKNSSPRDNDGVDPEIDGWTMDETGPTSSVVATPPKASRDLNHVGRSEDSNVEDLGQGLKFGGELDYSETELNNLFGNIADLQPGDMPTDVFTGAVYPALLNEEVFGSMTETANSMLNDIGDIMVSQPASADTQSPSMAFDHARTSPPSSSRQTSDASGSDDYVAIGLVRARARTDSPICQCQRSILHVLAEVESNILSASPSSMYATLSYQRQATAASNSILTSRICNCKIEFFGLLEILGGKITSLSEAIIAAFVRNVKEQNDSVELVESGSLDKRLYRNSAIRLGEFQVQTLQEFIVVSAAAIRLQLKYSVNFVSRTRALAISMNRLAQAQSLKTLETRLEDLFIKMQRMTLDLESDCCNL